MEGRSEYDVDISKSVRTVVRNLMTYPEFSDPRTLKYDERDLDTISEIFECLDTSTPIQEAVDTTRSARSSTRSRHDEQISQSVRTVVRNLMMCPEFTDFEGDEMDKRGEIYTLDL